jgi:RNA polymerase sigma factor (sigma-70 family)
MNGEPNKNEGVRIIADFDDRAIPLQEGPPDQGGPPAASRSANDGVRLIADFNDPAQPLSGAGEELEREILVALLESAIAQLPPVMAEVLRGCLLEDQTIKETAEALHLSEQVVRARRSRLLQRLRQRTKPSE